VISLRVVGSIPINAAQRGAFHRLVSSGRTALKFTPPAVAEPTRRCRRSGTNLNRET
jgi:hypothetical protein